MPAATYVREPLLRRILAADPLVGHKLEHVCVWIKLLPHGEPAINVVARMRSAMERQSHLILAPKLLPKVLIQQGGVASAPVPAIQGNANNGILG